MSTAEQQIEVSPTFGRSRTASPAIAGFDLWDCLAAPGGVRTEKANERNAAGTENKCGKLRSDMKQHGSKEASDGQ
jgi:hypothetical protein